MYSSAVVRLTRRTSATSVAVSRSSREKEGCSAPIPATGTPPSLHAAHAGWTQSDEIELLPLASVLAVHALDVLHRLRCQILGSPKKEGWAAQSLLPTPTRLHRWPAAPALAGSWEMNPPRFPQRLQPDATLVRQEVSDHFLYALRREPVHGSLIGFGVSNAPRPITIAIGSSPDFAKRASASLLSLSTKLCSRSSEATSLCQPR